MQTFFTLCDVVVEVYSKMYMLLGGSPPGQAGAKKPSASSSLLQAPSLSQTSASSTARDSSSTSSLHPPESDVVPITNALLDMIGKADNKMKVSHQQSSWYTSHTCHRALNRLPFRSSLFLMAESAPSSAQRARLNRSTHRQRGAGILRDLFDVFYLSIDAQSERRCERCCSVCYWADKSLHGVPWSTNVLCVGCRRLAVMNNVDYL